MTSTASDHAKTQEVTPAQCSEGAVKLAANSLKSNRGLDILGFNGPGYFLVDEDFARRHCHLADFEAKQRLRSDEARRANDSLTTSLTSVSRRFLIHRSVAGVLKIFSEHLVGVDEDKRLVVLGPVPVAGSFKHEEVRATRRIILAFAQLDPRFSEFQIMVLTTRDSTKWKDSEVIERMGYARPATLTRAGIGWLASVTQGAEVDVFYQLDDRQLVTAHQKQIEAANANVLRHKFGAEISASRSIFLRFWRK